MKKLHAIFGSHQAGEVQMTGTGVDLVCLSEEMEIDPDELAESCQCLSYPYFQGFAKGSEKQSLCR